MSYIMNADRYDYDFLKYIVAPTISLCVSFGLFNTQGQCQQLTLPRDLTKIHRMTFISSFTVGTSPRASSSVFPLPVTVLVIVARGGGSGGGNLKAGREETCGPDILSTQMAPFFRDACVQRRIFMHKKNNRKKRKQ